MAAPSFLVVLYPLSLLLVQAAAQFAPNVTYQALQNSFAPSSYVYNPPNPVAVANNVSQLTNIGGTSTKRSVNEWPTLAGNGISQTAFTLGPCGLRQPHEHPRGSGILFAINAVNLQVGIILLDGTKIVNNITTGASALFPQGLVHYQQNLDCTPATYVISYNDAEAQTVNVVPALLALPVSAVELVLGIPLEQYSAIKNSSISGNFVPGSDPTCMSRCGLSLTSTSKVSGGR